MIAIRGEIEKVSRGEWPAENNPLKNAPHTLFDITRKWERSYSIAEAITPLPYVISNKFFPTVNRVDNAYGDKNLVCSCPPLEDYV